MAGRFPLSQRGDMFPIRGEPLKNTTRPTEKKESKRNNLLPSRGPVSAEGQKVLALNPRTVETFGKRENSNGGTSVLTRHKAVHGAWETGGLPTITKKTLERKRTGKECRTEKEEREGGVAHHTP